MHDIIKMGYQLLVYYISIYLSIYLSIYIYIYIYIYVVCVCVCLTKLLYTLPTLYADIYNLRRPGRFHYKFWVLPDKSEWWMCLGNMHVTAWLHCVCVSCNVFFDLCTTPLTLCRTRIPSQHTLFVAEWFNVS